MYCEICDEEKSSLIIILPIKQTDGKLNTLACLDCAEKSSAYCIKHKLPHLGYEDGTTACKLCIDELVNCELGAGAAVLRASLNKLPVREINRLSLWATDVARIINGDKESCILRAFATKALREKITIREVMVRVSYAQSVEGILPTGY